MKEIVRDIISTPGVQPSTDFTSASTPHFVAADKVRFVDGFPEKIGGWQSVTLNNSDPVNGCARSIFSYSLTGNVRYIIGTHLNLYYLIGSQLTNITPSVTATTAIANSLDSNFATLANNPVATVSGSNVVTITDTATKVRAADTLTLSGSSAVNGVPAGEINTTHFIRTQSTNSYTFNVSTNATSTGSGGGASVVQATKIVTVNQTAHGFSNGERTLIQSAGAFAGIPAGNLNIEHIIRNKSTNAYDIVVTTTATSSVSGGGGASTTVQGQIADGLCDATAAQGYGAGKFGVGLFGTVLTSSSGEVPVRSWITDRFGDNIITTPGEQTGLYTWDSDTAAAPALLSAAPTAINYAYVSNEIIVTFGADNVGNRRKWCDKGVSTTWAAASTNQAGEDDIEGASAFISHLSVKNINLEFTDSQVYTSRYIGRPFIWETKLLDNKSGIISKNARVEHNGVGYWWGSDNWYYYRGGSVNIIPSNTTKEATLKKFVFDDINLGQKSKIFGWFNRKFNEIWFHYPSAGSDEPDRVVRINVKDLTWVTDTHDRSAGEYPTQLKEFPYLASSAGDNSTSTIYQHEKGADNDGSAMAFSVSTGFFDSGLTTANVLAVIPDSIQTGNITCTVNVKKFAQSPNLYGSSALTITPTTEAQSFRQNSRYIQYIISGNALGQTWRAGKWQELLSRGGKR